MANSRQKCTGCKKFFPIEIKMIKTPAGKFHDFSCMTDYASNKDNKDRLVDKGRQIAIKEEKKELKKRKESLRDKKWYLSEAQKWFNKFIRLRDAGLPCISCDKPDNGFHQRHASHYRSVGSCSYLRFNEMNVHASCSVCNNHLSGNIGEYTPRLMEKIGGNCFEEIKNAPKLKRWDVIELKEIIETYKLKCKALEAALDEERNI